MILYKFSQYFMKVFFEKKQLFKKSRSSLDTLFPDTFIFSRKLDNFERIINYPCCYSDNINYILNISAILIL